MTAIVVFDSSKAGKYTPVINKLVQLLHSEKLNETKKIVFTITKRAL